MEKIRLGVIGFGNMGTGHVKSVAGGKVPDMVMGAICDIAPARCEAARRLYPDIPVFGDAQELYGSGLCDAVIIATPHYYHPPLAMQAFAHGLHVITEKPAGVYTSQVKEMNAAAERSDRKFGIMYNQRTNPVYQKLREMVQKGSWAISRGLRGLSPTGTAPRPTMTAAHGVLPGRRKAAVR